MSEWKNETVSLNPPEEIIEKPIIEDGYEIVDRSHFVGESGRLRNGAYLNIE